MVDVLLFKWLAMGSLFIMAIVGGGGLLHLLPEAVEDLNEVAETISNPVLADFPYGYFLCGLGFFSILLIEEIVLHSANTSKPSQEEVDSRVSQVKSTRPPAGSILSTPKLKQREFLKLYYGRRKLAKSIMRTLTPRTDLQVASQRVRRKRRKRLPIHIEGEKSASISSPLLSGDEFSFSSDDEEKARSDRRHSMGPGPSSRKPHSHRRSSHGHGHDGGDGHSHLHIPTDEGSALIAYLLVLALSFHSVFEGIALGTQEEIGSAVGIFIAIMAHTPLAGFALGVSLVKAKAKLQMLLGCIILFSLTVPVGCLAGIFLEMYLTGDVLHGVSGGFQSFSSGTFLFVALEEIIPKELTVPRDKGIKLMLCLLGFFLMASIKLFDDD